MIVVSDTSALNYLILIGHDQLLPQLFGKVYTPPTVIAELRDSRAPNKVKTWIQNHPSWLIVQAPKTIVPIPRLEQGELEAIALAQELCADLILIDDRKGVTAAEQLGLPVIGTLNVLKRASLAGLLDLTEAIESLKRTTFRWSQSLIDQILRDTHP